MPSRKTSPLQWGELDEGSKRYYTDKGITAASFNKWHRMSQIERTELSKQARAHGYESGLQFTAVQTQVKKHTGKTIKPTVDPKEAARRMIAGSKRKTLEGRYRYRQAAKLFDMTEWDHLQWTEFMSP